MVKEVDRKCVDLFWSIPKEKSKVTLIAWDSVRQTKKMGEGVERYETMLSWGNLFGYSLLRKKLLQLSA